MNKRHNLFYKLIKELFSRVHRHDIVERAYGLAFNFTLAIFPAIIFSFTLIPYIPIQELEPNIISFLKDIIPGSVYEALLPTIQDTVSMQRRGLLSFGFISTLYLATNGMASLIKTFHVAEKQDMQSQRGYLKQRVIATLLTLGLAGSLFCTILLVTLARQIVDYILIQGFITGYVQVGLVIGLRVLIIFLMAFSTVAGIYYLAPATKQHKAFVAFGALFATIASLMASFGFSYYVNNFANYNRLYGSLGVMIALMVWLFLLSIILLVGFEFTMSLAKTRPAEPNKPKKV